MQQPLPAILGSFLPVPPPLPICMPITTLYEPDLPPHPPIPTSSLPPISSPSTPVPPTPLFPSCPPVHLPSLFPTPTVAGSLVKSTKTEPSAFTLALATIALPAPTTIPITAPPQLPCNLCKTSPSAFPVDNICIPLQPGEWYSMIGDASNDLVDLEYTVDHPTPHRLSLVDIDCNISLSVNIDGVLARSTSDDPKFHGDALGRCLSTGFSQNNFIIPPSSHTVKVACVGNLHLPHTEEIGWESHLDRQLMWRLDLCT